MIQTPGNTHYEKVLLTGGCGFIGSHICKRLIAEGKSVFIYDNMLPPFFLSKGEYEDCLRERFKQVKGKAEIIKGDIRDRETLRNNLKRINPDIVVHLAAISLPRVVNMCPEEAESVNVGGTNLLLESLGACRRAKRFVYLSSSFVYGNCARHPVRETHRLMPIDPYGKSKLAAERLTRSHCRKLGIAYTIIRPTAVYGPGDVNRRVCQLMVENALAGEPMLLNNGGSRLLDFTYITDFVNGIIRVLGSPEARNQVFNISRGKARTVRELAEIILRHIPSARIIADNSKDESPNRGSLDISKAMDLLGFDPQFELEDGIKMMLSDHANTEKAIK